MIFNHEQFEKELAEYSSIELELLRDALCDLTCSSWVKRNGNYKTMELHTIADYLWTKVLEEISDRRRDLKDQEERFSI